jgi:hypothetical protein
MLMDSLRDQLLSCAAFTLDQNRNIRPRNVFNDRLDSAQLRVVGEENLVNSLHNNLIKEQFMCQGDIRLKDNTNSLKLQWLAELCLNKRLCHFLSSQVKRGKNWGKSCKSLPLLFLQAVSLT